MLIILNISGGICSMCVFTLWNDLLYLIWLYKYFFPPCCDGVAKVWKCDYLFTFYYCKSLHIIAATVHLYMCFIALLTMFTHNVYSQCLFSVFSPTDTICNDSLCTTKDKSLEVKMWPPSVFCLRRCWPAKTFGSHRGIRRFSRYSPLLIFVTEIL